MTPKHAADRHRKDRRADPEHPVHADLPPNLEVAPRWTSSPDLRPGGGKCPDHRPTLKRRSACRSRAGGDVGPYRSTTTRDQREIIVANGAANVVTNTTLAALGDVERAGRVHGRGQDYRRRIPRTALARGPAWRHALTRLDAWSTVADDLVGVVTHRPRDGADDKLKRLRLGKPRLNQRHERSVESSCEPPLDVGRLYRRRRRSI